MQHDPKILKNEAQIEELRLEIPDWIKKLERNAARDKRVQRALRNAGWRVLVVWECQTQRVGLGRLQARLGRFLSGPAG